MEQRLTFDESEMPVLMAITKCPALHYSMLDNIRSHHGEGGRQAQKLVEDIFLTRFRSVPLQKLMDAAVVSMPGDGRLAVTTQACVVQPIFFPGGDIGRLALLRAVNNLATEGASPRFAAVSFILEEGLPWKNLEQVVSSMAKAAAGATVEIIAGDTRVVSKGDAAELYISVTAIGVVHEKYDPRLRKVQDGDRIVINSTIAEHGIAVLSAQEGKPSANVLSDVRSLHQFSRKALELPGVKRLKDISRGGLSAAAIHIAGDIGMAIELDMEAIPIRDNVKRACQSLGLDPLYVPAAGGMIAVVSREDTDEIVRVWSRMKDGGAARVIGRVERRPGCIVTLRKPDGETGRLELKSSAMMKRVG